MTGANIGDRHNPNGTNNLFIDAISLSEDGRRFLHMISRTRPALIIKIMEEPDHAPCLFVPTQSPGASAHRPFYGQPMLQQRLGLGIYRSEISRRRLVSY
ncbi:MAG: hypothetical protein M2R46_03644 [Verrucomicrobia subdivision 3 bacterium]|nr:hypothetical protein [Limisphaerales bacterium]